MTDPKSAIPAKTQCTKTDTLPNDLEALRETFKMFDQDANGEITIEELRKVLHNFDIDPTAIELQDIMGQFDVDGNGTINLEEFLRFLDKNDPDEDILAAFRVFDKDHNGVITREEFKRGMSQIGEAMSEEEMDIMFKLADEDNDGFINPEEFRKIMKG